MTESTPHCAIEIDSVRGSHYDSLLFVVIVYRRILELADTTDEPLDAVGPVVYAIRFAVVEEVTLVLVSQSGLSMLFGEMAFVFLRWSCSFGLEECLEFSVYKEVCSCAIGEIAE